MRALPVLGLSLAALLVLVACSSGGTASPSTDPGTGAGAPATANDLDGRTFLSSGAVGYALAPGSQVRLTFEGVRLGASAGCNQMGAEYSIDDGVLALGPMMSTEMACEEPLMSQETWLASFLPGASVALAGETLTLAKQGVVLTLVDEEVANPDRSLEGTRWVVDGIVTRDAVSSIPAGTTAALVFEAGRVNVEAGCNTGSGSANATDGTIDFGPIALTAMACPDDQMQLETAVLAVLDGVASYTIDADTLTLQHGADGLVLKAAS